MPANFGMLKLKHGKNLKLYIVKNPILFLIEESHSDINSMTDWMNVKNIFKK